MASNDNSTEELLIEPDRYDERATTVRMLVILHALLHFQYDSFVLQAFLDPGFKEIMAEYWGNRLNKLSLCLKATVFAAAAVALPYVYANSIMRYPCTFRPMQIVESTVAPDTRDVELAVRHCFIENELRAPASFLVMPAAAFIALVLWLCVTQVDHLSVALQGRQAFRPGEFCQNLGRRYIYDFLSTSLRRLKYTHPLLFSFICAMYAIMMGEMLAISALQRSGVAGLVGLAVGRFFLAAAEWLLSPPPYISTMIDAELDRWPSWYDRGMVDRLRNQNGPDMISTCQAELEAVGKLTLLRELAETAVENCGSEHRWSWMTGKGAYDVAKDPFSTPGFFRMFRPSFFVSGVFRGWYLGDLRIGAWRTYPALRVYITDTNEIITAETGDVRKVQRDSPA